MDDTNRTKQIERMLKASLKDAQAKLNPDEIGLLIDGCNGGVIMTDLNTPQAFADDVADALARYGLGSKHPNVTGAALVNTLRTMSRSEVFALTEWLGR